MNEAHTIMCEGMEELLIFSNVLISVFAGQWLIS